MPLSLSCSFIFPYIPPQFSLLSVLRKKLIKFLISPVSQSSWIEGNKKQSREKPSEQVWERRKETETKRHKDRGGERDRPLEIDRQLESLKSAWITAWFCEWEFLIKVLTLLHNDWLTDYQTDWLTDKLTDWMTDQLTDCLPAPGEGWKYITSSHLERHRYARQPEERR